MPGGEHVNEITQQVVTLEIERVVDATLGITTLAISRVESELLAALREHAESKGGELDHSQITWTCKVSATLPPTPQKIDLHPGVPGARRFG